MIKLLPQGLLQSFVFVYRVQKREYTLKRFTNWFGSHFITASMYSQFMFTVFHKIYRLLRPTYQATSFQGGLSLVSSLSLVNFCREIQEISFHSLQVKKENRMSGNTGWVGTQDEWVHRMSGNTGWVGTQDEWKQDERVHRTGGYISSVDT